MMLLSLTHLSASVKSQNSVVNLTLKNVSVEQALTKVEKQLKQNFFFNRENVDLERKVDLQLSDADLDELVLQLFGRDYKYRVVDNIIVVSRKDEEQEQPQQIKVEGVVKDKRGDALPGVTVLIKGTKIGVATDLDGKYSLLHVLGTQDGVYGMSAAGRGAGFYADGSYTYGTAVLHPEKSADAEFKDTLQRIAKNTNRFEYGETPDAESLAQTEALLAFCARAGIEVTAFLPPYAPSVWQRMQETGQYGYIPATFASLETMFARYGFEVFDYSYLPETNDSQYVDGFHGSDRVYAALCARLAEDSLLLGAQFDSAALTALFTAQGNPLTVSLP